MTGSNADFERTKNSLPLHKAPDGIWEHIEYRLDQLENQSYLQQAVKQLPTYTAPKTSEIKIFEERLSPKNIFLNRWYVWLSGAAAAILIFAILVPWTTHQSITVTHSEETIKDHRVTVAETVAQFTDDKELISLIEDHCQRLSSQCATEEFETLYHYYLDLNHSKAELIDAIEQSQQVHLLEYLVRVEKEKNEIGKQLMQMLLG